MDNYRRFLEDKGYDLARQWNEFERRTHYRKFNRNEIIVAAGALDSNIYFLEKGCVHYFTLEDGREYTHDIIAAPSAFGATFGLYPNEVSGANIQALTNSDIYILNSSDREFMNNKYPVFKEIGERTFAEAMKKRVVHGRKIAVMTAEERYIDFMENHAEFVNILPQYILASYLGITPESLSRIKKRIYKKL